MCMKCVVHFRIYANKCVLRAIFYIRMPKHTHAQHIHSLSLHRVSSVQSPSFSRSFSQKYFHYRSRTMCLKMLWWNCAILVIACGAWPYTSFTLKISLFIESHHHRWGWGEDREKSVHGECARAREGKNFPHTHTHSHENHIIYVRSSS